MSVLIENAYYPVKKNKYVQYDYKLENRCHEPWMPTPPNPYTQAFRFMNMPEIKHYEDEYNTANYVEFQGYKAYDNAGLNDELFWQIDLESASWTDTDGSVYTATITTSTPSSYDGRRRVDIYAIIYKNGVQDHFSNTESYYIPDSAALHDWKIGFLLIFPVSFSEDDTAGVQVRPIFIAKFFDIIELTLRVTDNKTYKITPDGVQIRIPPS